MCFRQSNSNLKLNPYWFCHWKINEKSPKSGISKNLRFQHRKIEKNIEKKSFLIFFEFSILLIYFITNLSKFHCTTPSISLTVTIFVQIFRFFRWLNLNFFEIPDLVIFTIENQHEIEILTKIRISPSENREKYWKKS